MSKKKTQTQIEETVVMVQENFNVEAEVKKKPGRPVVENSARQMRLSARAARFSNGEVKKGRPVVENSARQMRLAAQAARIASGAVVRRGRPKVEKQVTDEVTA